MKKPQGQALESRFPSRSFQSANAQVQPPGGTDRGENYQNLLHRFAKVMAISDKFQAETMDMANKLRRSKEELEQAQRIVRQSEERFRTLSENLPVGVSMIGPDLQILALNPRMREWFPQLESESHRGNVSIIPVQVGVGSVATSPLHKTLEDGETYSEECEVDTETGRRYMRITTNAVKDADGRVTAVIQMVEDISARKQMELDREEIEARERSLEKAESLDRMAAAIAHHFNNQLQSVTGYLEMALQDRSESGPDRDLLNCALLSAQKAAEVSVLMRSYLGQSAVLLEPTDLSEVCRQKLPGLRSMLPRDYTLEVKLPGSGPSVNGNADDIEQILTSLFTNAWEAIGEGRPGGLCLSVDTVDATAVPAENRFPVDWHPATRAYGCLSIADTGKGLEKKDIERIFDPFFSEKFAGRGLGLSVVLGLMRRHAGVVVVESERNKGSTFRCYFPLTADSSDG